MGTLVVLLLVLFDFCAADYTGVYCNSSPLSSIRRYPIDASRNNGDTSSAAHYTVPVSPHFCQCNLSWAMIGRRFMRSEYAPSDNRSNSATLNCTSP